MNTAISLSDLHILLVEPSETQQKIISKLLNNNHVKDVEISSNVTSAKASIAKHQPDLVISAMYFEDGTGMDLFQSIREDSETEHLPCMLVSSEFRVADLRYLKDRTKEHFSTLNFQKVKTGVEVSVNAWRVRYYDAQRELPQCDFPEPVKLVLT